MDSATALMLQNWRLSSSAIEILSHDLDIVARLVREKRKPCFSLRYSPSEVEVWHDRKLHIRINDGQLTYLRHSSLKIVPTFVEVKFDRQLAMFLVNGEMIVDRTPATISLTQLVTNLKEPFDVLEEP